MSEEKIDGRWLCGQWTAEYRSQGMDAIGYDGGSEQGRKAWNALAKILSDRFAGPFVIDADSITPEMIRDLERPGKIVLVENEEPHLFGPEAYERTHPELLRACLDAQPGEVIVLPSDLHAKDISSTIFEHHRACGLRRGEECTCGPTP